MMRWLKLSCLLMYGSALAGWTGVWTGGTATAIQILTLVILATHALEALIGFKYVRLYRGALFTSIVLTLLFGLLHLWPLEQEARRATRAANQQR